MRLGDGLAEVDGGEGGEDERLQGGDQDHLEEEEDDGQGQRDDPDGREADGILDEYRERLKQARVQAEEIVVRARKAAENTERETVEHARQTREEILEQARRDAEASIQQAVGELRQDMADLTVLATEKVTRKALTDNDQRRLVEEALGELDFEALSGGKSQN